MALNRSKGSPLQRGAEPSSRQHMADMLNPVLLVILVVAFKALAGPQRAQDPPSVLGPPRLIRGLARLTPLPICLSVAALALRTLLRPAGSSSVPLVSLAGITNTTARDAAWRRAAALGVARLEGHGIDIDAMLDAARALFALPLEAKRLAASDGEGFGRGYIPLGGESGLASFLELKEGFCFGAAAAPPFENALRAANRWPVGLGDSEQRRLLDFYEAAERLSGGVARALLSHAPWEDAQAAAALEGMLQRPGGISLMRLFHYLHASSHAALAPEMRRTGSSPHTDWHLLTIVLQDDVGGLQVTSPSCHSP